MSAPELYPYQIKAVADFNRERAAGRRRIILVSPTGSGKTIVATTIIKQYVDAWKNVVALSHRREIITHTGKKLRAAGISHGLVAAGFEGRPLERVQVASIQTLHARAVRSDRMDLPPADLLWIDEAHHVPAESYKAIIAAYPDAILLGTTATPCRGDGRGLGSIFETMIQCPQVGELIAQSIWSAQKSSRRSIPISAVSAPSPAIITKSNLPTGWIARSWSATS